MHKVVKVAADGARGQETHRHVGVGPGRRHGRQQAQLDFAGHRDVALQLRLLRAHRLIELRILDGDGHLRGQRGQHTLMLFIEEARAGVFQVEHADDAPLVEERHNQLRAGLRIHRHVTRVFAHIGHVHQPPLAHRRAHQPAGDGQAAQRRLRRAEAPGVTRNQRLAFFVQQHDGKHLVVDQPAQQLSHPLQQRVQIQNRRQLRGDLVEHCECLRLAGDARIESRILNRLGDARGGQRKQAQVFGAEVIGLLAFDVHHTDQPVLGNQWHRQLGAYFGIHLNVHLRGAHVVQQHRLAGKRHLAHHALAHGDVQPLDLRNVADLEPHPQFVSAVVDQQNGEDAVGNHGRHQLRGAPQQGFQIQRGVQRVGKPH